MTTAAPPGLFDVPPGTDRQGSSHRPDFIEVSGTLFRTADYDTPVWSRDNTRPGRWHVVERRLSVQYWSYSPDAAWAESLRAQGIREPQDVELMRSRIWAGQICLKEIADLTDPAWLHWLDLAPEAVIGAEWEPCQRAATALRDAGANGLVAPSAALPDCLNLVIFRRMVRGDWFETPNGPRILRYPETIIPCRHVATGYPQTDLTHRVHYR